MGQKNSPIFWLPSYTRIPGRSHNVFHGYHHCNHDNDDGDDVDDDDGDDDDGDDDDDLYIIGAVCGSVGHKSDYFADSPKSAYK